jgi:26S proteasome regulatory subunit N8
MLQDGTTTSKTFVHTPSIIEAEEAEEIGVEHLLRDIRDVAVGTLSTRITSQLQSLQGLHLRLRDIGQYLQKVLDGTLPVNHAILGNLQDVFNLLPNLSTPKTSLHIPNGVDVPVQNNSELAHAMSIKTNDQLMAIYLSSLIRAITAFHDLIEKRKKPRKMSQRTRKTRKQVLSMALMGRRRKAKRQKRRKKTRRKRSDDEHRVAFTLWILAAERLAQSRS